MGTLCQPVAYVSKQCSKMLKMVTQVQNSMNILYYSSIAVPADIGRKPAPPARGNRQSLHAGESRLRGDAYSPANETAQQGGARMKRDGYA